MKTPLEKVIEIFKNDGAYNKDGSLNSNYEGLHFGNFEIIGIDYKEIAHLEIIGAIKITEEGFVCPKI